MVLKILKKKWKIQNLIRELTDPKKHIAWFKKVFPEITKTNIGVCNELE